MKLRLSYLALLIAVPSIVCAGSSPNFAKEVRFVSASQNERVIFQQSHSYDLVWNSAVGKFEAQTVMQGEPLILENPLELPVPALNRRALAI